MPKQLPLPKRGMLLALFFSLFSMIAVAQKTVVGKVAGGTDNRPVAGATVTVKGSKVATQTDANGTYKITVPNDQSVLVITAVGFETLELATTGKTDLSATLTQSSTSLNEVVVIGYGTTRKKDLSGAVSSINAATIEKVPVTSLDQALQGRAAGVQITNNDGAPGANVSVLIRGVGSPGTSGNLPLYVIDGYPVTDGINNINPSDIASIDVLKDASATAIYGVRAANGVVMITTKKGKKGGIQVSLDAFNAFQSTPKQYKLLNAQQWATLANEVADADQSGNFNELAIWRTPTALTNIDWQKAAYRNSLTQSFSLGIRGGSDKVQLATSVGYYNQKGIVLGSYFKRLTLGVNLDAQPTKWLKSSTSAKYSYQKSSNPFGTGNLVQLAQLPPTMDSGNRFTSQIKDGNGNYGFYNPVNTYVSKYSNPIYNIENNEFRNVTNYFLVNSSLEATIFSGLRIKTMAGANISTYNGSFYQPEDPRSNDQYGLGGPTQNAFYSVHNNNRFEWLWENTISYDKTFGAHTINFVGGVSAQKNTIDLVGVSGIPPNSTIRDLRQLRNLQFDLNGNGQIISSIASEFARVTYKFADKYIITGTVRRDGSSKFETGHKYGVFPSGAIAWKAKEEKFLQDVKWLTDLRVRGSYGKVGNEAPIGLFQYQSLYSTGANAGSSGNLGYPFNDVYQGGIAATQPANPDLRWETDYQTDIGVDASFLRGELTLTVDWFNRKSKDFLLTFEASPQTGYTNITRNVGEMTNKGLEVALNYNHKVSKDFNYGIGLTFSTVKNKLTALSSGQKTLPNLKPSDGGITLNGIGWTDFSRSDVGGSIGDFFGYQSLGIFQTQAQIDALNAASVAKNPDFPSYQKAGNKPGDRYFADMNGDGHISDADRVNLGSPLPKFYGGLNLDATYKAFDFNVYFYGVYGNKIFNYVKSSLQSFQNRSFVGVQNVSYDYYVNHWTPTNPSNVYGRPTYNDDAIGSNVASSAWIENGSFLKLKNLTVGYTLPLKTLSKLAISKVRVYVSTQNLFTITKYSGLDPEIGIQNGNARQNGIDNGAYPSSKFYTLGLNVTF